MVCQLKVQNMDKDKFLAEAKARARSIPIPASLVLQTVSKDNPEISKCLTEEFFELYIYSW